MKHPIAIFGAAAALLLAQTYAYATMLTVVKVNAPAVNCVFDATCKVIVQDSVGNLTYSQIGGGARLQSRTFKAKSGTPGAGHTAYLYRVDLTGGAVWSDCVAGIVINFGPVGKLTYPQNTPGHVFVITSGGLGSVGIKSAEQSGDVIDFTFDKLLCAGQSGFFFGLAAKKAPVAATAVLYGVGRPSFVQAAARVPQH